MSTFVEITDVKLFDRNTELLLGRHLDRPKAGTRSEGPSVEIAGWVLGRRSPAVAVECVSGEAVVGRAPLNWRRPDVAKLFGHVPEAINSGFRTTANVTAFGESELGLRAVLEDQTRAALGVIRIRRRWRAGHEPGHAALVSVVIPCHNQAHFLNEAIESVLAQTYPHFEIVVIDDGSSDNTSEVVTRYPGVQYVRQENRGLAAARNTGIRLSSGSYIVCLDADDCLRPQALEVGLRRLSEHPECAFASGQCELVALDRSPFAAPQPRVVDSDHYRALLQGNYILSHATVMYRRAVFTAVGGFDESLPACEDYDLYLRITRAFPVYCHDAVVAEYRWHGSNMQRDPRLMLTSTLKVLRSQRRHAARNKASRAAYKIGLRSWRKAVLERSDELWAHFPRGGLSLGTFRLISTLLRGHAGRVARLVALPKGRIRLGDLRRLTPIADGGRERGMSIDGCYVERFLLQHADDVRGSVLEVRGDSINLDQIAEDTYDCVIFVDTGRFIGDMEAVLQSVYRLLKPGGVLLAACSGMSLVDQAGNGSRSNVLLVRRRLDRVFSEGRFRVKTYGNVLVMAASLYGLGAKDLRQEELEYQDPAYPLVVAVRAIKAETHSGVWLSTSGTA